MMSDPQPPEIGGLASLAPQLAPALVEACDGRLTEIRWFKSDWQRGGAATGYARFACDGGVRDVVIKLPVGPTELKFHVWLSQCGAPTPRVVFHGESVGGYDLGWLVMERLPGDPLAEDKHASVIEELITAAAHFQKHASEVAPNPPEPKERFDWPVLAEKALKMIHDHPELPEKSKWKDAVKSAQKCMARLVAKWNARPITGWCHGDLHAGNAMRRPEGSVWGEPCCVLLDLAEVHPGHWTEDAVYLERLHWGKPELLHGHKPVKLLAAARRRLGLDNGENPGDVAMVRRVLMASVAPAFFPREGHPKYLHAALEMLEKHLQEAVR